MHPIYEYTGRINEYTGRITVESIFSSLPMEWYKSKRRIYITGVIWRATTPVWNKAIEYLENTLNDQDWVVE